jgi:hypothetical protein
VFVLVVAVGEPAGEVDVLGDCVLDVGREEGWLLPLEHPAANTSARLSTAAGRLRLTKTPILRHGAAAPSLRD